MKRTRIITFALTAVALLWWRVPPYDRLTDGTSGFVDRAANHLSDGPRRSVLFVPPEHIGGKLPLIVYLHGFGENGLDGRQHLKVGLGPVVWDDYRLGRSAKAFALFPQSPFGWTSETSWCALLADIDAVCAEYPVDPAKVCLTGLSDGGAATWKIAVRHPRRWAALAPIGCRAPRGDMAPLSRASVWMAMKGGASGTGAADAIAQLKQLGAEATLTVYDARIADCSNLAYSDARFWQWLRGQFQISTRAG